MKMAHLDGSFEEVRDKLRSEIIPYLTITGTRDIGERYWSYIVATFSDYVVACVEKPEAGVVDEFRYWKMEWVKGDEGPEFTGEPSRVDVVTTTELVERSPLYQQKNGEIEVHEEELSVEDAMAVIITRADDSQWQRLVDVRSVRLKNREQKKVVQEFESFVGRSRTG